MSGLVESLLRWLRRTDTLPTMDVPSAVVSDNDCEVWGDHMYMRGLLDDLARACAEVHEATVPHLSTAHSAALDAVLADVRNDAAWQVTA